MDIRRSPWSAVVRLAIVVSAIAVGVALALSAFGDVSQTALVIAVIVVGFIVSWVQSGRSLDRDDRAAEPNGTPTGGPSGGRSGGRTDHGSHRVVVVPLHHHATRRAG